MRKLFRSANTVSAMPASPTAAPGARFPDRYLCADGARLRYRDEGQGPPVVLVHGWTLDLEMWDPQVDALRSAFRLVRLDRRGHGQSGGVPAPGHDALDLAALCRHLGLARGALLQAMIERYPARDLLQETVNQEPSAGADPFETFRVPALLINGACDLPRRLEAAARLGRRLPAAEHALVPDAGHLPNLDNPG